MHQIRWFILSLMLICLVAAASEAAPKAGSDMSATLAPNLLTNPSFEGNFRSYTPPDGHAD